MREKKKQHLPFKSWVVVFQIIINNNNSKFILIYKTTNKQKTIRTTSTPIFYYFTILHSNSIPKITKIDTQSEPNQKKPTQLGNPTKNKIEPNRKKKQNHNKQQRDDDNNQHNYCTTLYHRCSKSNPSCVYWKTKYPANEKQNYSRRTCNEHQKKKTTTKTHKQQQQPKCFKMKQKLYNWLAPTIPCVRVWHREYTLENYSPAKFPFEYRLKFLIIPTTKSQTKCIHTIASHKMR